MVIVWNERIPVLPQFVGVDTYHSVTAVKCGCGTLWSFAYRYSEFVPTFSSARNQVGPPSKGVFMHAVFDPRFLLRGAIDEGQAQATAL